MMVSRHPQNTRVLAFLSQRRPDSPVVASQDALPNPYYASGCHPEIVERLWDHLGNSLPTDCRMLIHGTPALVHPTTGVILGVCIGTQYGLRVPDDVLEEAVAAGAKTLTIWNDGTTMNIGMEFGRDWVFGAWIASEVVWCNKAYAATGLAV